MRLTLAAFVAATPLVSGCVASSLEDQPTNNPDVVVERIADHDGCTIYRFRDGQYHWYVRCNDRDRERAVVTLTPQRCGKGCTRDEAVTTVDSSE
jgi:hypothetical protein